MMLEKLEDCLPEETKQSLREAARKAAIATVDESIQKDILKDYLVNNREEVLEILENQMYAQYLQEILEGIIGDIK